VHGTIARLCAPKNLWGVLTDLSTWTFAGMAIHQGGSPDPPEELAATQPQNAVKFSPRWLFQESRQHQSQLRSSSTIPGIL